MSGEEIRKTLWTFYFSVKQFISSCYNKVLKGFNWLEKWIGIDGLLNMETCIILVCMIDIFFDGVISGVVTIIIAVIKTCYDKYKSGHEGELHDFICCITGVIIGIIISTLNAYFNLIV